MIRLNKSEKPALLKSRAKAATDALWKSWRKNNSVKISSLYRSRQVKETLREDQHNKCAYCENSLPRSYGNVEHYRPKNGWKQNQEDELSKHGYFWLAYEWKNLFLSCDLCNDQRHKGNLFPLKNPTCRATGQQPNHDTEKPLLLNPYVDEPSSHIIWNREIPIAKTPRGETTIKVFRLEDDEALMDDRRSTFKTIEAIINILNKDELDSSDRECFVQLLRKAVQDSAPYAAMIRSNFGARISAL